MSKTYISKSDNEFTIISNDKSLINLVLDNEYQFNKITPITKDNYEIKFSESLLIKEGFEWLKDTIINSEFNDVIYELDEFEKKTKKIELLESKFPDISYFENLDDWDEFKEGILSNFNGIEYYGEFSDITRKQLMKTYIYSDIKNIANFSEPGTGKTITTLMFFFNKQKRQKKNMRLIVVCPINAIKVWREEVLKFTNISENEIHIYRNDYNAYNKADYYFDPFDSKVIILNYEAVENFIANRSNRTHHGEIDSDFIVYDEVHRVKSGGHYFSKSFNLSSWGENRAILTGTPYSNNIQEVKNIFQLNWSGQLPSISESDFIEYDNIINNNTHEEIDINKFRESLDPYYFKLRKKEDFAIEDAIDGFDDPIIVEPLPVQKQIDINLNEKILNIQAALNNANDLIIKTELEKKLFGYISLSQMNLINPLLLLGGDYDILSEIDIKGATPEFKELPKIKAALKLVKSIVGNGEKIIIWMRYRKNIEDMNQLLNENGINSDYIHGNIGTIERDSILERFNDSSDEISVLVTNPDTLAESISLHKHVHNSLFVELGFSYYQWMQAKDRIHRVGIPAGKIVRHFYLKSPKLSMEKNIYDNLRKKMNMDKKIFNTFAKEDDNAKEQISFADLLFSPESEIYDSSYNLSKEDRQGKNEDKRYYDFYDKGLEL